MSSFQPLSRTHSRSALQDVEWRFLKESVLQPPTTLGLSDASGACLSRTLIRNTEAPLSHISDTNSDITSDIVSVASNSYSENELPIGRPLSMPRNSVLITQVESDSDFEFETDEKPIPRLDPKITKRIQEELEEFDKLFPVVQENISEFISEREAYKAKLKMKREPEAIENSNKVDDERLKKIQTMAQQSMRRASVVGGYEMSPEMLDFGGSDEPFPEVEGNVTEAQTPQPTPNLPLTEDTTNGWDGSRSPSPVIIWRPSTRVKIATNVPPELKSIYCTNDTEHQKAVRKRAYTTESHLNAWDQHHRQRKATNFNFGNSCTSTKTQTSYGAWYIPPSKWKVKTTAKAKEIKHNNPELEERAKKLVSEIPEKFIAKAYKRYIKKECPNKQVPGYLANVEELLVKKDKTEKPRKQSIANAPSSMMQL